MGPARGRGTEGADSNPHREAKRPSPIARHLLFPTHRQSALGDFRSITPSGAASPDECSARRTGDRKSVGEGKRVSVRVDMGGRSLLRKKKQRKITNNNKTKTD